ncbi:MAG: cytochrome c [Wenzhouxiangella sp.]|nr:cytochrome c [Wenzhouxiangella sp.]
MRPSPATIRAAVATAILVVLTACNSSTPPTQLAEGQEPYLRYCASCHGNQGEGKPPAFPPLAGSEWMELPSEALALIVLYGLRGEIEVAGRTYRGYMPPMQHLSDEDIAALLGFAERAWAGREAGLGVADIARLRTAFTQRRPPLEGLDGLMRALDELP